MTTTTEECSSLVSSRRRNRYAPQGTRAAGGTVGARARGPAVVVKMVPVYCKWTHVRNPNGKCKLATTSSWTGAAHSPAGGSGGQRARHCHTPSTTRPPPAGRTSGEGRVGGTFRQKMLSREKANALARRIRLLASPCAAARPGAARCQAPPPPECPPRTTLTPPGVPPRVQRRSRPVRPPSELRRRDDQSSEVLQ